ncbi:PREDICTED: histone-lysine N-methyltransferase SETMAR-like, partial [Atta colombica]|uniref:histone-lysine N-methyltransferase SETMAR-like n=1 Tax=Atta colombica TaxID=520822 RepID=UPI00084C4DD1
KTAVYERHERFKSGRESVEDDERSGRPSTSKTDENINKMREMLINNRKLTIRELTEDLNIAYGSIQDIVINGLGLRRVAAKLVPKELNFMQKRDRIVIAKDMISKAESDIHQIRHSSASLLETRRGFMSTTCNPDIRQVNGKLQMSQDQKKPRRFQSKKKAMLTVFMDTTVLYHEFLPESQTINKKYYLRYETFA